MKKSKKICALLLALVMVMSLTPMAFAAEQKFVPGKNVSSISVEGLSDYTVHRMPSRVTPNNPYNNVKYVYTVSVPAYATSEENMVITFTPQNGTIISPVPPYSPNHRPMIEANKKNTYTVTWKNDSATLTVYAYHNLAKEFPNMDIYTFNFMKSALKNPREIGDITVRFGDPAYELTPPERYMSIDHVGDEFIANYKGPEGDSSVANYDGYYPDRFAIGLISGNNITSITSAHNNMELSDSTHTDERTLNPNANEVFFTLKLDENSAQDYILKITTTEGTKELNFHAPKTLTVPGGSGPSSVVSYLPIGQFAKGKDKGGWGSSIGKFTGGNGFSSTGVSLGALGGYIEFKFDGGIANNPNNPYGVDFVVYGNAFNGNPEAGAVQVSEDGKTWYELAGSEFYRGNFNYDATKVPAGGNFSKVYTGTKSNTNVTYTKSGEQINVALGDKTPVKFVGNTDWMPSTTKGYPMGTAYDNTGSNISVSLTDNSLSFGGITAIEDSDVTGHYAFGYADVTPNGTISTYGAPANPYEVYSTTKVGGDGFDLEWAVNPATGAPVDISNKTFRYVRVYSAVLENTGIFGETSAEVCGIFTTNTDNTSSVGVTPAPVIKVKGVERSTTNGNMQTIGRLGGSACEVEVTGSGNVFINGERATSGMFTPTKDGTKVQVIVQNGEAAPYITWLNLGL